jgi:ribosomal-protein-serine acetyltransferase
VIHWEIDEHAIVRTLTLDDAEEAFRVIDANRDRLHPWMPWEPNTKSPADTRQFIERALASDTDLEGNGIWVDRSLAGGIGMGVDTVNDTGEIGYWIGREFEGRGLVTRAARLFVDHGFRNLGLHRISIHAAVENVRSRAVAERLGFAQEAVLRGACKTALGYRDLAVYGMVADEWPPAA